MLSLVSRAAARGAACAAALPSSLMPGAQAAWLHSSRAVWADEAAFLKAKEAITAVPSVDNMDKLKLYALFKQATVGANDTKAPGMLDFVVRPSAVQHPTSARASLRCLAIAGEGKVGRVDQAWGYEQGRCHAGLH